MKIKKKDLSEALADSEEFLVEVLGRKSDDSLYDNSLVSFDEVGDYNQKDAEGFIKISALRLKNKS